MNMIPYHPYPVMKNGLATAALVFGLLGVAFAPITLVALLVVAPLAFGFSIAGLVMSIYGIRRADRGLASNRRVAVAALALNAVALGVAIAGAVAIAGVPAGIAGVADAL